MKETESQCEQMPETSETADWSPGIGGKIRNWASNLTFHGLPNIARTDYMSVRIMWIICTLFATVYTSYSVANIFLEFLEFNTITRINFERQSSLEFPTVTICNLNPFKADTDSFRFKQEFDNIVHTSYQMNGSNSPTTFMFASFWSQAVVGKANLSKAQLEQIGYNIDDMLLNCLYNYVPCDKSNFSYTYSNIYGNCYSFNSGRNMKGEATPILSSTNPGRVNGLMLDILIDKSKSNRSITKSNGVIVFIHNSSHAILDEVDGVVISTGSLTEIVVGEVIYEKLSYPFSNCIDDLDSPTAFNSDLFVETINKVKKYEQRQCFGICIQKHLQEMCHCQSVAYPTYGSTTYCLGQTDFTCMLDEVQKFFFYSSLSTKCAEQCPQECYNIFYDLTLSQSEFPSVYYSNLLRLTQKRVRNMSDAEIKLSTASINVFFSDLIYQNIVERPSSTLEDLISDIGGVTGLCIGASLLSFVEIVELLMELSFGFCESRKPKRGPSVYPAREEDLG